MRGEDHSGPETVEDLLHEMRISEKQRAGSRFFEPPPGYAWGHANLPEIWKGNWGGIRVIRGESRRLSEKSSGEK